jgi:predicted flap endonuclease-1-like 5' DNA nuclease
MYALLQFPANLKSDDNNAIPRSVLALDEEGFRRYLKKTGKSEKRCESEVHHVREFEDYLSRHKNKKLGAETSEDLKGFVEWAEGKRENVNVLLWVLNRYYSFTSNDLMSCAVNELLGSNYMKEYNLKEFLGVNHQHIQALRKEGILTSEHMLKAGRTEKGRRKLAEKTGVPLGSILELVKLADLSRIVGLKKKRARLYYDAGLDTLDKIAKWDSEKMHQMFAEFVERTGFDGSPPPPPETAFSVKMAKYLPRIVEY